MTLPLSPCCVITGAASGFGRALSLELSRRSAHLILADLNGEACAQTAEQALEAGASSARVRHCDVTQPQDVEALAASCERPVDLLVNNAGVSSSGCVGELPLDDWRFAIDVDLWGVIYCCHVFVPVLRRQSHGHILNVASAAGLFCAPQMGAYNVAKAGVIALSETLASELLGTGVGVTVLCPTFFKSNIAKNSRFLDAESRATAERLVASGRDVESVVRAALADVESGQLYSLPMSDARWAWRFKRLAPRSFPRVIKRTIERSISKR